MDQAASPSRSIRIAGRLLNHVRGILVALLAALAGAALAESAQASVLIDQTKERQVTFEISPSNAARDICMRPAEYGPTWIIEPSCTVTLMLGRAGEVLFERATTWSEFDLLHGSGYETSFTYNLSCSTTGKLRWQVLIAAQEGSGWSQEISNTIRIPKCVKFHRTYMLSGRARQAVLKRLRGEYVSSIRCKGWSRRWGTKRCVAIYSRSYRTCIGTFRTREYEWGEFGTFYQERMARLNKRRCFYY